MQDEVLIESSNLREIIKPFIKRLDDNCIVIASKSQFIRVGGYKFYIGDYAKDIKEVTLCKACKGKTDGFIVTLNNNKEFPKGKLVAFQCDSCKQIYIITIEN